ELRADTHAQEQGGFYLLEDRALLGLRYRGDRCPLDARKRQGPGERRSLCPSHSAECRRRDRAARGAAAVSTHGGSSCAGGGRQEKRNRATDQLTTSAWSVSLYC